MPKQSADGTPHLAYFDAPFSFVWDGTSPCIEVCEGGYGEPVVDRFTAPAKLTMAAFKKACTTWLEWSQKS